MVRLILALFCFSAAAVLAQDAPKDPKAPPGQDPKAPPSKGVPAPPPTVDPKKVATDDEADAAIAAFKKTWAVDLTSTKVEAIKKLAETRNEKVIKTLAVYLTHPTEDIAAQAAIQLGNLDHHTASDSLALGIAGNLTMKRPVVVASICSSLGKLGYESSAPTLNKLIDKSGDDEILELMEEIFTAVGRIGSATSVDPLIDFRRKAEHTGGGGGGKGKGFGGGNRRDADMARLRGPCDAALRAVTGGEGGTANEWEAWWKASKADLIAAATVTYICKQTWERLDPAAGKKPPCPKAAEKGHDTCLATVHLRMVPEPTPRAPRGR